MRDAPLSAMRFRRSASKVVQRASWMRYASFSILLSSTTATMMLTNFPVLLPVGRIVRGWNIIRAYGSPPPLCAPITLARSPSRSRAPTLSKRYTCLARNSLPPAFFSRFLFFPFRRCRFAFFRAGHGERRGRRTRNPLLAHVAARVISPRGR